MPICFCPWWDILYYIIVTASAFSFWVRWKEWDLGIHQASDKIAELSSSILAHLNLNVEPMVDHMEANLKPAWRPAWSHMEAKRLPKWSPRAGGNSDQKLRNLLFGAKNGFNIGSKS